MHKSFCANRFAIFFLLPSAFFLLFSKYSGFSLHVINFDLFIAAGALSIIASIQAARLAMSIYICVLMFQVLQLADYFYGISLRDLYVHLLAILHWPITAYFIVAASLLVFLIFIFIINNIPRRDISIIPLLIFLALFLTADIAMGPSIFRSKDSIYWPNIVGSPVLGEYKKIQLANGGFSLWEVQPKTYLLIKNWIDENKDSDNRLLIITFESLGAPKKISINNFLSNVVKNSLPDYELLEEFNEPSIGGTLNGELRLLCGIRTAGNTFALVKMKESLDKCIPNYGKKFGVMSVAGHGNSSSFYNRKAIYPAIGFELFSSYDSILTNDKIRRCSTIFNAACDSQVVSTIIDEKLVDNDALPKIVYVMTIDTHFPLVLIDNQIHHFDGLENRALEIYFSSINNSLADLNKSIVKSVRPPDYLIIHGDHPPPFLNNSLKSEFKEREVPVFLFRKRKKY